MLSASGPKYYLKTVTSQLPTFAYDLALPPQKKLFHFIGSTCGDNLCIAISPADKAIVTGDENGNLLLSNFMGLPYLWLNMPMTAIFKTLTFQEMGS
jgi:hypothetical protein